VLAWLQQNRVRQLVFGMMQPVQILWLIAGWKDRTWIDGDPITNWLAAAIS
jgi:hypothetical protein